MIDILEGMIETCEDKIRALKKTGRLDGCLSVWGEYRYLSGKIESMKMVVSALMED